MVSRGNDSGKLRSARRQNIATTYATRKTVYDSIYRSYIYTYIYIYSERSRERSEPKAPEREREWTRRADESSERSRRREGIISPMQIAFGLEPVGYTLGNVVKVTPRSMLQHASLYASLLWKTQNEFYNQTTKIQRIFQPTKII